MVALKIFFGQECRRSNLAPATLQDLKEYIYSVTGLRNPKIQYKDEEGDLISIYTESEYRDLLENTSTLLKITVSPSKLDQSTDFSLMAIDSPKVPTPPHPLPPEITTKTLTPRQLSNSPKSLPKDSCSIPQDFSSAYIESLPFSTSTVKAGSPDISPLDKYAKSKVNLLESIRGIIRKELGKGEELKMSGLMHKHEGVVCSQCGVRPIVGIRYRCSECPVNFCEICEFNEEHEHPFYKMKYPESGGIEIKGTDMEGDLSEKKYPESGGIKIQGTDMEGDLFEGKNEKRDLERRGIESQEPSREVLLVERKNEKNYPESRGSEVQGPDMQVHLLQGKDEKKEEIKDDGRGIKEGEKSKMYELVKEKIIKSAKAPEVEKKMEKSVVEEDTNLKPQVGQKSVDGLVKNLDYLKNMGFADDDKCLHALKMCNNDLETAIDLMFNIVPNY